MKNELWLACGRYLCLVAGFALSLTTATDARAQIITATLSGGSAPAINPITNKIYAAGPSGALQIIDGATNTFFQSSQVTNTGAIAVNQVTNKIYVANGLTVAEVDGTSNLVTATFAGSASAIAINSITNKIYAANGGSKTVTVIDGQSKATDTVQVGTSPTAIAVDEVTNKIYVANKQSGSVTIIDGATDSTRTVLLPSGSTPAGLAVNPVSGNLYVASYYTDFMPGAVVVINEGTGAVSATVPVGYVLGAIAINTVTNKIYVGNTQGSVFVIDGVTNQAISVPTDGDITSLVVNEATNHIYAANFTGGSIRSAVTIIDGATNKVSLLPLNTPNAYAFYIAVNPITNKVYAATTGDGTTPGGCSQYAYPCLLLVAIDASTAASSGVSAGASPRAVAVNTAANQSYVINSAGSSVTVINGATQTSTNVPLASNPVAVATNPITNKAYISTPDSNSVTVLDGSTNGTTSVPIGARAGAIATNPATNTVYVANPAVTSGQITILNGATNAVSTLSLGNGATASQDIAVNPATNRIYVETATAVVVVDGATSSLTTVPLAIGSGVPIGGLSVNPATNKIYVVTGGSVTVIDGATNTPTNIPLTLSTPQYIQVNPITNKIYVTGVGAGIAVIDGATNAATLVTTTGASGGLMVNPVTNKIYDITGATLTVMDGISNTTWTLPLSAVGTGIGINPVTDQIYVSIGSANSVQIFSELPPQANPLTTSISPLPGNQTSNTTPSFTFSAQSTNGIPPTGVYYQVDTWQSSWTAATASNPGFTATLPALAPGLHTLYAFAVDGRAAGTGQSYNGYSSETAPISLGAIQAYTFLISQPQGSSVVPTTGTPFVTAQSLSSLRNNYSGSVGFEFTVGSSAVQVSSLGRYVAPGNSGTHLLKLVQANGSDVAGGSATLAINTAAGQYQYAALTNPVTLAANTTYYLVSAESAGGDQWYDISGVTAASAGAILAPVYTDGFGTYVPVPGLAGKSYVPLNFLFSTGSSTPPPPPPTTTTGTSFVTAQTPGPQRNNYTGSVGYTFTVTQALTVTALGRYVAPGNAGSHLLQLVSVDGSGSITPLASASAALAGATAGQFDYVTLGSSVTLQPGVTYYLTSQETAGGDNWYDIGGVSVTAGTVLAPVYTDGTGRYVPVSGLSGKGYVPVSFLYASSGTTPPPPTTTATALITGQTASTLRNNFGGFVGTALQVGATPLTVTSLGRFDVAGNSGTHTVKLVQANGTDVPGGSVTINLAGGTAGQYTYATLAAPVTLQANTTYYLVGQETGGGDKWYDLEPVTATSAAQVLGAVYVDGSGKYVTVSGLAGYSYGPLNLQYQ